MTLEELKSGTFVVGMKETERAIEKQEAACVLLPRTAMKEFHVPSWKPASRQEFLWNRDSLKKK